MQKIKIILAASLLLSGCGGAGYEAPNSWTIRADGHLRASQRKEDYTLSDWLDLIKKTENYDFGICTTPKGAAAITNELKQCHIDLDSCKNGN